MKLRKQQALDLLWERPIEIGHWLGFKDLTDLHNYWLRMFLYSSDDLTLQGHRGSFKTTTLSLFLAEHIIIAPNETTTFFRKTGSDVSEVLQQTANILKAGCVQEIVNAIYGKDLLLLKDSHAEIHTNLMTGYKGTSQIVGLGIGTSITGKHSDVVVTDDIVNVNDRVSYAERERTKRAYQELQNVKNRGGRFINTGTPWHKDDCFTLMPKPMKYDCYQTGLMSEADIQHVKDRMTASLFAANYELKHIADDDIMFINPVLGADTGLVRDGVSHVDAAYGGEDYTAFTICKVKSGKFYVYGRLWQNHIDNVMDEVVQLHENFMCGKLYKEFNDDKGFVAKELRKRGLRVQTYNEHMNKHMKISSYLKFHWKDVIFVAGTDDEYIEQICDYNENAEHDDAPDSLASIIRQLAPKIGRDENTDNYMFY